MRPVLRVTLAGLALTAGLLTGLASAASFSISEMGSRASGRGYAVAALYDNPSTIYYNPANISRLEGVQLDLGATAIMPRWQWSPVYGSEPGEKTKSETGMVPPPSFSATYNIGNPGQGDMAVGLGVYVPFGSTFAWPEDWAGRGDIQKIALQVIEVAPAIAWRPAKELSIGATFRYMPSQVYLKQAIVLPEGEGDIELAGGGTGYGASVGIGIYPNDRTSLALTWRSGTTIALKGDSDITLPAPFDASAVDRDVTADLPLPYELRFGIAYEAIPQKLMLSADVNYQMWEVYKSLDITFTNPDGSKELVSKARDSHDTVSLHLGAEYMVSDVLALRAGYVFDQMSLPEATVNAAPPDSNKHVATVGASYFFGDFGVHAHFENVFFQPRTSRTAEFPGRWKGGYEAGTMAYVAGLSFSAAFDVAGVFPSMNATADHHMTGLAPIASTVGE